MNNKSKLIPYESEKYLTTRNTFASEKTIERFNHFIELVMLGKTKKEALEVIKKLYSKRADETISQLLRLNPELQNYLDWAREQKEAQLKGDMREILLSGLLKKLQEDVNDETEYLKTVIESTSSNWSKSYQKKAKEQKKKLTNAETTLLKQLLAPETSQPQVLIQNNSSTVKFTPEQLEELDRQLSEWEAEYELGQTNLVKETKSE